MSQTNETNEIDRIRQDLDRLIRGHLTKRPPTKVAKDMGVKADDLARFLAGRLSTGLEKMAELAKEYLDREKKQIIQGERISNLVETSVYKRMRDTAERCFRGRMGIAWGMAGCGKTRAITMLAEQDPSIIVLNSYPGYSSVDVMVDICKALNAYCTHSIPSLMFAARKMLTNSGRLIIVDEAGYLKISCLDILRRIHDLTHVGILLVGMPDLYNKFRDLPDYRQIDNRIRVRVPFENLTRSDAKLIIAANVPACSKMADYLYNLAGGDCRRLESLIDLAMDLAEANKMSIDQEVCDEALRYLEGT